MTNYECGAFIIRNLIWLIVAIRQAGRYGPFRKLEGLF